MAKRVKKCPHCHTEGCINASGDCAFCHRNVHITYNLPVILVTPQHTGEHGTTGNLGYPDQQGAFVTRL